MIDRARDSAIKASMDAFVTRAMMIDIEKGKFSSAHCAGDPQLQAICRSIGDNTPGGIESIISLSSHNYFCIQTPLNDGTHWRANSRGEVGLGLCGYVGYWSFAGNAQDLSPYANHGTIMSGTTNCTENPNDTDCLPIFAAQHGLTFDGVDDYVRIANLTDLSGSEITITAWFKGSVAQSLVRQQKPGVGYIVLGWHGRHILQNDGGTAGLPHGVINDGNWHFTALTWKQNTVNGFRTFRNGEIVAQRDSSNTPIPNIAVATFIGSWGGNQRIY